MASLCVLLMLLVAALFVASTVAVGPDAAMAAVKQVSLVATAGLSHNHRKSTYPNAIKPTSLHAAANT
jgi:hypothetical protein